MVLNGHALNVMESAFSERPFPDVPGMSGEERTEDDILLDPGNI